MGFFRVPEATACGKSPQAVLWWLQRIFTTKRGDPDLLDPHRQAAGDAGCLNDLPDDAQSQPSAVNRAMMEAAGKGTGVSEKGSVVKLTVDGGGWTPLSGSRKD